MGKKNEQVVEMPIDQKKTEVSKTKRKKDKSGKKTTIEDDLETSTRSSVPQRILQLVRKSFIFPIEPVPISFYKPEQFTESGEYIPQEKNEAESRRLEELVNFDEEMKGNMTLVKKEYERLIAKEEKYVKEVPNVSPEKLKILRIMFSIFDVNGDGLVEFEEVNEVFNEFGDRSNEEFRRKHFDEVDTEGNGFIAFQEFISFAHIMEKIGKSRGSSPEQSMSSTFRKIEHHLSQLNRLGPVQQLQSGLF